MDWRSKIRVKYGKRYFCCSCRHVSRIPLHNVVGIHCRSKRRIKLSLTRCDLGITMEPYASHRPDSDKFLFISSMLSRRSTSFFIGATLFLTRNRRFSSTRLTILSCYLLTDRYNKLDSTVSRLVNIFISCSFTDRLNAL